MRVFIETMGCPKNFNDSQACAGLLEDRGHQIVGLPSEADAIMVNTCGFIGDAKKESIERIFDMAQYGKLLIVSGCLSQRYGKELFDSIPEAAIMLGVNDYEKLPDILDRYEAGQLSEEPAEDLTEDQRNIRADGRELHVSLYEKDLSSMNRKIEEGTYSATLKISEGCNNRCTYCVIPKIRGPYRSVPEAEVIEEAKKLAAAGVKELILIAQDTTAYGCDFDDEGNRVPAGTEKYKLAGLLRKLCQVDGIEWIRILYAYEDRITDELIEVMAEEDKICKYIDIPLQHASDHVLKEMDRRSTRESIRTTLRKLRAAMDDIHIRTTLIVGFPGETEEDFDELLDMVETEQFDRLGVFAYSQEEGTPAGVREDQIPDEVKQERLDAVMMRQLDISLEANRDKIGHVLEVIIDEEDEDGAFIGRTRFDAPEIDNNVIVNSTKSHLPGDIIKVKVTDAFDYDIVGVEVFD